MLTNFSHNNLHSLCKTQNVTVVTVHRQPAGETLRQSAGLSRGSASPACVQEPKQGGGCMKARGVHDGSKVGPDDLLTGMLLQGCLLQGSVLLLQLHAHICVLLPRHHQLSTQRCLSLQ